MSLYNLNDLFIRWHMGIQSLSKEKEGKIARNTQY